MLPCAALRPAFAAMSTVTSSDGANMAFYEIGTEIAEDNLLERLCSPADDRFYNSAGGHAAGDALRALPGSRTVPNVRKLCEQAL